MNCATACVVHSDHPSLAGHFPGEPIVPAVVLLEKVLGSLEISGEKSDVIGISSAKFLAPLLPDQRFSIHLQSISAKRVRFECWREGKALARGELRLS